MRGSRFGSFCGVRQNLIFPIYQAVGAQSERYLKFVVGWLRERRVLIPSVCRRYSAETLNTFDTVKQHTTLKMVEQVAHDVSHQAISAYFIGPQAENLDLFRQNIDTILDEIRDARLKYFPEDGV